MRIQLSLVIIFFLFFKARSQKPPDDFGFMTSAVEKNYPGFLSKTDARKFQKFSRKIWARNEDEFKKLSEILLFFKDKHLRLADTSVRSQYGNAYCDSLFNVAIARLNNMNMKKGSIEGYWVNGYNDCIIGIVKSNNPEESHTGVVLKSVSPVRKGFPICFFYGKGKKKEILTKYIDPNFKFSSFVYTSITKDGTLRTGINNIWRKITSDQFDSVSNGLKKWSYEPQFIKFDSATVVIKIPSMSGQYAKKVDSIIKRYDHEIKSSRNFIIDVRNNTGGTSGTYFPLLPYIYTDTVVRPASSLYCSEGYINYLNENIEAIKKRRDTSGLKKQEEELQLVLANRGGYIERVSEVKVYDTVFSLPVNVAVLINYSSLSASEIMLLDFRQSKKVKFFGQPSGGAIDYVGVYSTPLPSKKYFLSMPSVINKGMRGVYKPLDATGIMPHVLIDGGEDNWYRYVINFYEKNY